MKVYTVEDIEALNPCSDHAPLKYVGPSWTGTAVDILQCTQVDPVQRFWVIYRLLDDKTLRLFAVACARRSLSVVSNPDPRSIEACNVAEKFANGEATVAELTAAARAATRAAYAAAYAAVHAAQYAAVHATVHAADAADAAARAAQYTAAYTAAAYAAHAAARAASTFVAWDAATYDAADSERQHQIDWLINYLRG